MCVVTLTLFEPCCCPQAPSSSRSSLQTARQCRPALQANPRAKRAGKHACLAARLLLQLLPTAMAVAEPGLQSRSSRRRRRQRGARLAAAAARITSWVTSAAAAAMGSWGWGLTVTLRTSSRSGQLQQRARAARPLQGAPRGALLVLLPSSRSRNVPGELCRPDALCALGLSAASLCVHQEPPVQMLLLKCLSQGLGALLVGAMKGVCALLVCGRTC